jgi:hypothetical protein
MNYLRVTSQILFLVLLSQFAAANDHSESYIAKDGKVDPATFIGYTTYHSVCVGCHGVGAVGTEVAPNLLGAVERLSPEQFRLKVMHRTIVRFTLDDWINMEESMYDELVKQEQRSKGELQMMPRWQYNPMVNRNVDNIYRYLKARAAGVIGPEKPGVLK